MRCLRCGREMGSNTIRCEFCRHYYESNLKKASATVTYFNSEEDRAKKRKVIIIIISIIVALLSIIVIEIFHQDLANFFKPPWVVSKCNLQCEGNVKRVIFNRCLCGDGKLIIMEK